MQPRHYLRCLGQPALFAPNGEPIRFRTKKHLALLVYLAVEARRAHRRDRLAEFLWPRAEIAEARHSLATALSILRPRLGLEALETTRDHVTVHPDRVTLDLDRLLARDILGTETTGWLDVASFLDGFEIPDAPEFAMWKDRQQARLLPTIKDALVVLIDRCRRTGDSRQIEQLADRMLVLDELSEEAIRAKMEARALAGDRLTALKVFEEWRVKLEQELHAMPSTPIEQMAIRMRRGGWERTVINDIPVVPPNHCRERAFIGRAREYSLLYEAWVGLQQGRVTHSLVLGDSGVGKTTLVERLTAAASLQGASVARVQAYDLERNIPFATLGGLILYLMDRPGASATPPEALAELARTAPELRRRFPTLPLPTDTNGETARIRLTESFHQLIKAISEEHPTILVVDDLHLADEPSLAVLHLALRQATGDSVLALFTARPGELGRSTQAAILRESLGRLGGQEVSLAPLDDLQSRELLFSLLQPDERMPPTSVLRSLVASSGGFPMVLELLIQDWRTHGGKSLALALNAMTADFPTGSNPTAAYGRILSRLTSTLEAGTRSALDLASVLGHRLNDLSMYSVIDFSLGQTMAALSQLSDIRVLRDGTKGLEFANEFIRAHAYAAVPSSVRRALHASVADRLSTIDEPSSRLEIAWHTIRSGRVKDAIPLLLDGARAAIRHGAPQSSERALSSALPSLQGEALVQATMILVEALQDQGRWQDSLDAIESLRRVMPDESSEEAFAFAALARAYLGTPMSDWLQFVPRLTSIMQTCAHIPSRVRAAKAVAHATSSLRDRRLARSILEVVEHIPVAQLDPDARDQIGLTRGLLLFQAGDNDACYEHVSAALEQVRDRGLASALVAHLQSGLGAVRGRQGRYEEAATHHENALRYAGCLGNDTLTAQISSNLALCYGRLGRYEDQLTCAESSPKPPAGSAPVFADIHLAFSMAFAHAAQGRLARLREVIRACEDRLGTHVPDYITQSWYLWKADALALAGLQQEALQAASRAVCGCELRLERSALAGVFARWTALTSIGSAFESEARELLAQLVAQLHEYDALDQVEILAAQVYCDRSLSTKASAEICSRLGQLPFPALAPIRATELGFIVETCSTNYRAK